MTKNTLKVSKIKFVDSPKLRANYICFLARQIVNNFYQTHRFFVLPYFVPDSRIVFFPNLNYSMRFWRKIQTTKPGNIATLYPDSLLTEVLDLVGKLPPSPNRSREWQKLEKKFWQALVSTGLFAKELSKISSISVHPTTFGTGGSFCFNWQEGKAEIFLTIRSDSPISSIASSLVKCLLMMGNEKYRGNFPARQEITNFLFAKTKLASLTPDQETKKSLLPKAVADSRQYLFQLGFVKKNPFTKKGNNLLINNKLARNHLSPHELTLLTLLFENRPEIVSHDQIANAIWKDHSEQKFSLWAITKLKQKLTKKLENLGVKNAVYTSHNQGYHLTI